MFKLGEMKIESLDHVALWVFGRDELAGFLTDHVGMHVIDRTDAFTIVGADARRGKLTLFEDSERREPGPLARIGLSVADLERALEKLPPGLPVSRPQARVAQFDAPEGLRLALVENSKADYDIEHVLLRVSDPKTSTRSFADLGFRLDGEQLRVGDARLELEHGEPLGDERSLLNHLGLRVESAGEHLAEARRRGLEVADVVDAENTYAVFVWGPDRIKLEYVEHKASFSLV
jgi:catechol 2,3-dioxygenase-like lactoylglutathione lyase family enzyme